MRRMRHRLSSRLTGLRLWDTKPLGYLRISARPEAQKLYRAVIRSVLAPSNAAVYGLLGLVSGMLLRPLKS